MIFRYTSLKTEGTKLLMNATITVKKDIPEDLSVRDCHLICYDRFSKYNCLDFDTLGKMQE